jgi:hypothetical protein
VARFVVDQVRANMVRVEHGLKSLGPPDAGWYSISRTRCIMTRTASSPRPEVTPAGPPQATNGREIVRLTIGALFISGFDGRRRFVDGWPSEPRPSSVGR